MTSFCPCSYTVRTIDIRYYTGSVHNVYAQIRAKILNLANQILAQLVN